MRGTIESTPLGTKSIAAQCFRNSYLDTAFALSFKIGLSGVDKFNSSVFKAWSESDATPNVEGPASLFLSVVFVLELMPSAL